MTTKTQTPVLTLEEIKDNFATYIIGSTIAEITASATWYATAQAIARELALTIPGITLEIAACIIASFSPMTPWDRNVFLATEFANGRKVATLGNNIKMATNSLTMGFDALKGQKTNAFARNIAGDLSRVTIDTWMIRAAGLKGKGKGGINKGNYNLCAQAITELAAEHGIAPAQMQALIWIRIRGSAE